MIVNDLSKQLGVKNKEIIDYLKSNGFKVSSHMQTVTDEMVELVNDKFNKKEPEPTTEQVPAKPRKTVKQTLPTKEVKKFKPDDQIPCRSLVPWKLIDVGLDKNIYSWTNYGDVEYVTYRDLQAMRRRSIVKDALILIEDPDLCEQWKHDLGDVYKRYIGVDYPEEFFDLSDDEFEKNLVNAPDVFKDVIKFTAVDMIRNENYPTLQKLTIIDRVLGTGIKEFL